MIGSFLMGLLQTTSSLGLIGGNQPIAWLKASSPFQKYTSLHLAFRTGFCGSLTTFSSWNSAMVVTLFGTSSGEQHTVATCLFRALFGYIIGMETALGSYVFGKKVAEWIYYKFVSPEMYQEAVAIYNMEDKGVYINPNLPTFERRFLVRIDNISETTTTDDSMDRTEKLHSWRQSTEDVRRIGHADIQYLNEIEETLLLNNNSNKVSKELEEIAIDRGWDITSLLSYSTSSKNKQLLMNNASSSSLSPMFAIVLLVLTYALLLLGLTSISHEESSYHETYRTMIYAVMLAPPGALLRWYLSGYNNSSGKHNLLLLLPIGTLAANVFGSMVSICCVGIEYT
eukprot:CAMPEP_0194141846 /NCGR_PEP_ID=MMETSP0152-20130528/11221_1 /TAXON_ID=1049557 /ORGANISM="Thalassiothrix antarctica, Strain L6-D1" /LENGTH=340 /DNA_ID=CAMNT_0038840611 /DNA_START=206 /DNA_END=1224 /DNA_ORIENTATION=+